MARNQDYGRREERNEGRDHDEGRRYGQQSEGWSESRGDYGRGGNFDRDQESWRGQGGGNANSGRYGERENAERGRFGETRPDFGRDRDEFGRAPGRERGEFGRDRHDEARERDPNDSAGWGRSRSGKPWNDEGTFGSETQRPAGGQGGTGWGAGSYGNPPGMTYGGTYGGTSSYGGLTGMGYYGSAYDAPHEGGKWPTHSPHGGAWDRERTHHNQGSYASQGQGSYGSQYGAQGPSQYGQHGQGSYDPQRYGREGRHEHEHEGIMEKIGRFFGKGPKGYRRSDERIEEEVNEALYRDPHIDASDIEVQVRECEVTLSGKVDDRHVKRMAEDCVWNVTGVKNVTNMIRVERGDVGDESWNRRTPATMQDDSKSKRTTPATATGRETGGMGSTGTGTAKVGANNT